MNAEKHLQTKELLQVKMIVAENYSVMDHTIQITEM